MVFSPPQIEGVTTAGRRAGRTRERVAFAIIFNERGQLYVRSGDGSRWYCMSAVNFGLRCECEAAQRGSRCRHIKGDRKSGAMGAARFLERLDHSRLRGGQLAFYWDTYRDPDRVAARDKTKRPAAVELASLY